MNASIENTLAMPNKNGLKWNVMAQKRSLDKAYSVGYPARVSRGMTFWPFILRSRSQPLRRINLNTPSFLNKLYAVPDCTADGLLEMPNANLPSGRASYQGISEGGCEDDDFKPRNKYKWCQDRQKYGQFSKISQLHRMKPRCVTNCAK